MSLNPFQPHQTVEDQWRDWNLRNQKLEMNRTPNGYVLPSTSVGGKKSNEMYRKVVELTNLKLVVEPPPDGMCPAPASDAVKNIRVDELKDPIRDALRELNQIERYCAAYPSDCGYYQKRKEELQKKLMELLTE